ncbi:MAG TPA: FkbM family methyltransferase [Allosphingosinicella sp.]
MTVEEALETVGRDREARALIIAALRDFERLPGRRFTAVRDEITGPLVDALHARAGVVRKELRDGLVFEFLYRSKIARDFVMAVPDAPDHVWEPQTTKLLVHLSRGGGDAIVGGAYFGDHAVPIAAALRGRGTCHAFEPDPEQAAMLARNAALNGLDNLFAHAFGLWSEAGVRLRFVGRDALASTTPGEDGVPATTIDDHVAASRIERVGLIMLDLEGAELEVLRGARRVLAGQAPHLVFEIHRTYVDWSGGLERTDIVRFLATFGYTVFAVRDFQSNVDLGDRPVELVPIDTVWLGGPPHGFNLLAVRDPSVVEDARFRIVPGVSPKLLFHRDPRLHHPEGGL